MIKVIVGVTPQMIMTPADYQLLTRINQSELTTLEYVMALWDMLASGDREHCFQYVIEGLEGAGPGNPPLRTPFEDDVLEEWGGINELEYVTHLLVDLLLRLYAAYYPALKELPTGQGECDGQLETVTVDCIRGNTTILNFFFANDQGYYQSPTGYSTFAEPYLPKGGPHRPPLPRGL